MRIPTFVTTTAFISGISCTPIPTATVSATNDMTVVAVPGYQPRDRPYYWCRLHPGSYGCPKIPRDGKSTTVAVSTTNETPVAAVPGDLGWAQDRWWCESNPDSPHCPHPAVRSPNATASTTDDAAVASVPGDFGLVRDYYRCQVDPCDYMCAKSKTPACVQSATVIVPTTDDSVIAAESGIRVREYNKWLYHCRLHPGSPACPPEEVVKPATGTVSNANSIYIAAFPGKVGQERERRYCIWHPGSPGCPPEVAGSEEKFDIWAEDLTSSKEVRDVSASSNAVTSSDIPNTATLPKISTTITSNDTKGLNLTMRKDLSPYCLILPQQCCCNDHGCYYHGDIIKGQCNKDQWNQVSARITSHGLGSNDSVVDEMALSKREYDMDNPPPSKSWKDMTLSERIHDYCLRHEDDCHCGVHPFETCDDVVTAVQTGDEKVEGSLWTEYELWCYLNPTQCHGVPIVDFPVSNAPVSDVQRQNSKSTVIEGDNLATRSSAI